jgi:hypothetical protein
MKQQSDDPLEFLKNRRKGAQNNAADAKAKGGDAILSYYHFEAKDKPYAEVMKALKNDGLKTAIKFSKDQTKSIMKELDFINDTQKDFQALMGKIEVYGECYIKLSSIDQ